MTVTGCPEFPVVVRVEKIVGGAEVTVTPDLSVVVTNTVVGRVVLKGGE